MKEEDLSSNERFFLLYAASRPFVKYTGFGRKILNTLSAYGLMELSGNMTYETTKAGNELVSEIWSKW